MFTQEQLQESIEILKEFKSTVNEKMTKISKAQDEIEKKMNRMSLGGPPGGGIGGGDRREELSAFSSWARSGVNETKAMTANSGPDGGFTVPDALTGQINEVACRMGAIRNLAAVIPNASVEFAQVVATNFASVLRVAEGSQRAETATPSLAEVRPPSCGYSAVAPISNWLLADSKYDLAAFIVKSIGKGIGIAEGFDFIAGDGASKPSGILSSPIETGADDVRPFGTLERVASGSASTLDVDSLITLLYRLAPEYRVDAAFVMNPLTVAAVRKLKDQYGSYLWQPGSDKGQPATLLGVPCHEDPNMPTVAGGTYPVIAGSFKEGYVITDIGAPMMIRDAFTSKGRTLFYFERRTGGSVVNSNAIKVLQIASS